MLGVGALFAAWFSYAMTVGVSDDNENQWRISLGLQNIPAGVLALLIMLFPESPRWLINHGKAEDGLKTLAKLHSNGNVNDAWVQAEFAQIQESISVEQEVQAKSYLELFRDKSCLRRLWIACSVQASIQMTGVAAIQYYSVAIYSKMGISTNNTLMYQAISNILALCAQGLCMALVDRLGRRWPLILGNVGNCITFIISTALLASFPPDESGGNKAASWAFIVMTWIYNFSFSATCGPLSWIIPAEIFDMKTRAKGVSIATAVNLAFNAMIAQTTSVALDDNTGIGWRWYILFIVSHEWSSTYAEPTANVSRCATLPTPYTSGVFYPKLLAVLLKRCAICSPKRRTSFQPWTLHKLIPTTWSCDWNRLRGSKVVQLTWKSRMFRVVFELAVHKWTHPFNLSMQSRTDHLGYQSMLAKGSR